MPNSGLEIIIPESIADLNPKVYGLVGDPVGIIDTKGNEIHVGDHVVCQRYGGTSYCGYVLRNEHGVPVLSGRLNNTNLLTTHQVTIDQSWSLLVPGSIGCEMFVRVKGLTAVTPNKVGNPFSLANLAANLLLQQQSGDGFKPDKPSTELLYSLFGGNETRDCPYMPEDLDEKAYSLKVQRWSPMKGHHFFVFQDNNGMRNAPFTPLAYLRIDEDMGHGPSSHLNRVTNAYFFCEHLNARFKMFLDQIHTKPKFYPRAVEITDVAVELALTTIWDSQRPKG